MKPQTILYKDKWLRWIGIPLLVLLMQHIGIGWAEILEYAQTRVYWNNLIVILLSAILYWYLLRRWILWLDQRLPYRPRLATRLLVQIGVSVPFLVALNLLVNHVYVKVLFEADYWTTYWTTDIPVLVLVLVFINFLYVGLFLWGEQVPPDHAEIDPSTASNLDSVPAAPPATALVLTASWRNQTLLVPVEDVMLIESRNRITYVFSRDGKRAILAQSLQQVFQELPETDFFLANRQYIVHRQILRGYHKTSTRKLLLQIDAPPRFEEEITVSKARSAAFLDWLSA